MKRHFNTHLEGLDLQFWHDLIESRGKLVSLSMNSGDCIEVLHKSHLTVKTWVLSSQIINPG